MLQRLRLPASLGLVLLLFAIVLAGPSVKGIRLRSRLRWEGDKDRDNDRDNDGGAGVDADGVSFGLSVRIVSLLIVVPIVVTRS